MTTTMSFSPEIEQQARVQLDELLRRSATDMPFRARLLSEPNAAYTEQTGNAIPAGVRFAFIEKKGKTTIVLPPFGVTSPDLSDAELETVNGGSEPISACAVGVIFLTGVALGIWGVEKLS